MMSERCQNHPGPALLAYESRVHYGSLPQSGTGGWSMAIDGNCFRLQTGTGYGFLYRKGAGVTVDRRPEADPEEEELWLRGSTYAAIAAIHGFLPFHASAVAWHGKAFAFAGPSGAGKSTLAAALGHYGMPLLCDDTMVLDVSHPANILSLPGHKRLKLKDDALRLTRARPDGKVGRMIAKHYAQPPGGTVQQVLPLARVYFLETGISARCSAITGAKRIARLDDDHYTARLYAMARGEALAQRFIHLAELSAHIPMERLALRRDPDCFNQTVEFVAAQISAAGSA